MKFDHLKSFLQQKNNIIDGNIPFEDPIREISFEHVAFRYNHNDPWVLKDINFSVKRKGILALVGLNGSGKSTLIKLLLRFYDPTRGRILINGVDIRQYTLLSLRRHFSVYFQGMDNFPLTIRENFQISCDEDGYSQNLQTDSPMDCDDHKILRALKSVAAEQIVEMADNQLDKAVTRVFDGNGLELSVGQFQKLSLARALFRQHEVLILDEPTANIDAESERTIFQTMRSEAVNHYLLWICHSLTDLKIADQIMLISNGIVEELGTHEELMEKKGLYYTLYQTKVLEQNDSKEV